MTDWARYNFSDPDSNPPSEEHWNDPRWIGERQQRMQRYIENQTKPGKVEEKKDFEGIPRDINGDPIVASLFSRLGGGGRFAAAMFRPAAQVDHSDVGFVPASADHSDVGFVPDDPHGMLAKGAHYAAKALPVAGGIAGGIVGGGAGGALGLPTTGPGALVTAAAGVGMGVGLGTGAGLSAQHAIDLALGYEKPAPFVDVAKGIGKEAATTGVLAAGGELALPMVMQVPGVRRALQAVPDALEAAGGKLRDVAVSAGRRVLTGGASLQNSTKVPLAREAVEEALDSGAIRAFGTTKGAAGRLQDLRSNVGDQYSKIVIALKQAGIEGPSADALAQKMVAEGRSIAANSLTDTVPNLYQKTGESLAGKPRLPSGNLDLGQAENMKRSLFREAKYGSYNETPLNEAKRDLGSMVKTANEDAITQQLPNASPTTQAIGAQFEPVKERLGNIIAASKTAEIGAGRTANRVAISPRSAATGVIAASSGAGLPASLGVSTLTNLAMTRGASTVAAGANAASGGFRAAASASEKLLAIASSNPAALGRYGAILSKALQSGGQQAFDAHAYALSQTDPQFQELNRRLAEGDH